MNDPTKRIDNKHDKNKSLELSFTFAIKQRILIMNYHTIWLVLNDKIYTLFLIQIWMHIDCHNKSSENVVHILLLFHVLIGQHNRFDVFVFELFDSSKNKWNADVIRLKPNLLKAASPSTSEVRLKSINQLTAASCAAKYVFRKYLNVSLRM